MWTVAAVLLLAAVAGAITRDQFYPYGAGLDQRLPHGANVSSPQITLSVPIAFYGEIYDIIYVNNYGILTFRENIPQFLNSEFPLPYPSIAAFYTNIDTSEIGAVYFRETNESHVLAKAEDSIQSNFHNYFDFVPTSVFLATWNDVTYTNESEGRRNSFQIAVISNGTDSFVELLYPERDIQWIQKETLPIYLPDAKAQAGFIAEDGRLFTLRGSGSHQIRNIVSWSNVHDPGRYIYRVGVLQPDENIFAPDLYDQYEVEIEEESKTCAQSGTSVCHIQARCVDYQAGICCQCIEGFYGNGKSCIKNNVPLRLNGKLNGVINNVNLNDVNVQAYVVIADGRTYAALTQAPPSLGTSLQTLSVLGGVIGWLFAKPIGSAKNGYQFTGGVFNYTADILYPETGDRVTINQEFLGHDVFDQITFDTDIRGSIPIIPAGTKIEVIEFQELYTSVAPGLINSVSSRIYINRATSQAYEQRVTQTFSYIPCKFAPVSEEDNLPLTLKVVKNYLGYEMRENIVRYGTTNKVILNDQEDPCIEGRNTCAPHSTCVAEGDTYTCVCQSGFTNIYYEKSNACIDIDECAAGTHNCDTNADCFNHEGGFQCRCRENFEGNGVSCKRISRCRDNVCDPNASCVEGPQGEPICVCNEGFALEGNRCYPAYRCDRCSPDAHCQYHEETNSYSCQCNEGYIGNGYDCEVEEATEREYIEATESSTAAFESTSYAPTEPAYNEEYVLANCGEYGCYCHEGYSLFKDSRNVDLCRLDTLKEPGQSLERNETSTITCTTDSECPPNAICSFSGEQYYSSDSDVGHCVCPEGYKADAYECLDKTGPSCSCGAGAHCIETNTGDMACLCDIGYHGDGYDCRPNFSCQNNSDCEVNAECRRDTYNELVCQCIAGFVKDQSDACIPDGQLCNGAVCADHASCLFDETLSISYCQCDSGFEGDGVSSCVAQGSTCDVTNDCNPYAVCTLVASTYQCICREGYTGDGYVCNPEASCRTNHFLCDQHASCLKTSDGYECECNTGYNGNGSHCELNPRLVGNFLVASDGASVYRVPFKVTPREFATPLNSGVYQIAVGIDVDCQSGRIYWGDVGGSAIKRAAYDGSGSEQFLSADVQAPEGISVDWAARNIFWTDSKKLTIEVANLDTKVRKVLFRGEGIFNPRGIVVHPGRGKIFWSDWNRSGPKIEWANMDGSQRGVFLDQVDVKLPNSLAIDWMMDRLCYADAGLFSVRCVGIDNLEREVVASNCSYPFGLAINGEQFYWSDWKKLKIEYIDNLTQIKGQVPIATASRRLYGVAVAPDQCPGFGNACQDRNGYCQMNEICLPDGQGGRTCVAGDY